MHPWKPVGPSWLFDLAEAIGLKDALALKEDPRRYLGDYITRNMRRQAEPESLPTDEEISEWRVMLKNEHRALRYLIRERGLSPQIINAARLGFDGKAITIPIYDVRTRELVNLRRRFWPRPPASGGKYQGLAGRTIDNGGVTLYPMLPPGAIILTAGEFDALVLWRYDLPGLTITSGAGTRWKHQWTPLVKGRRVALLFDADPREQEQALSRAVELRQAGADAWPVRLTKAGLSKGEDVSDFFVRHKRTRGELLNLIEKERHRYCRRSRLAGRR